MIEQTEFLSKVKRAIVESLTKSGVIVEEQDIFIVWYCKTLKNHKALLGCIQSKNYFEATHNGEKGETYLDTYIKENNEVI